MKIARSALVTMLVASAFLSTLVHADDDKVPVIQGENVTRENLLNQLAPPNPAGAVEVERGISKLQPSSGNGGTPAGRRLALLIKFIVNSAKLDGSAKSSLDILAEVLRTERLKDTSFVIEGHADPTGSPEYNRKLSQARAESVVKYLATQGNVRRDRLRAEGKGSSEPYNREVPSAPENRRVVVVPLS